MRLTKDQVARIKYLGKHWYGDSHRPMSVKRIINKWISDAELNLDPPTYQTTGFDRQ